MTQMRRVLGQDVDKWLGWFINRYLLTGMRDHEVLLENKLNKRKALKEDRPDFMQTMLSKDKEGNSVRTDTGRLKGKRCTDTNIAETVRRGGV